MSVNVHNTDYIYMWTNNAIISNNQSKDLIALWCLQATSKTLIKLILLIFLQSTNDGLRKSRCVYWPLF